MGPKMCTKPDQIFPIANFVLSHDGHFGLGLGRGGGGAFPHNAPAFPIPNIHKLP